MVLVVVPGVVAHVGIRVGLVAPVFRIRDLGAETLAEAAPEARAVAAQAVRGR